MPTPLGVAFVILAGAFAARGRFRWALSLGAAVPVGVVATISGNSIPVFYFLAIWALAAVVLGKQEPSGGRSERGGVLFLVFVGWSLLITGISPFIFSGIPVLAPRGGIDSQLVAPSALTYTPSNLAQVVYVCLGVGVVFYLGRSRKPAGMLLAAALGGFTILSFARLVALRTGLPFPRGFFDNSVGVSYVEGTSEGLMRFRGIFAEPSELAISSLVAAVFFLCSTSRLTGAKRWLAVGVGLMAIVNMVESTATTALAAAVIFGCIFGVYHIYTFVFRGERRPLNVVASAHIVLLVLLLSAPFIVSVISETLLAKSVTASFAARSGADLLSLAVLTDTWGLGAGLGSNRPSSLIPMLVSNVGIVGLVLFGLACLSVFRATWANTDTRAVSWSFLALMVGKCIASPNLSDPLIWLFLGALSSAAWSISAAAPPETPLITQDRKLNRRVFLT